MEGGTRLNPILSYFVEQCVAVWCTYPPGKQTLVSETANRQDLLPVVNNVEQTSLSALEMETISYGFIHQFLRLTTGYYEVTGVSSLHLLVNST